jgi:iron(III) transport system permease protein
MVKKWNLPRIDSKFAVIALSVVTLVYFIVLPLAVLIYDSVMVNGTFDLSNYAAVYSQKVNLACLDEHAGAGLRGHDRSVC